MIIDVKKHLFIGVKEDLEVFLKRAQKKGMIQFINPKGLQSVELPTDVQELKEAFKILSKHPLQKKQHFDQDPFELAKRVIKNKALEETLLEKVRLLKGEIARIAPLGNFSLEEIQSIEKETGRIVQFFCVKKGKKVEAEGLIHVGSEYDMDYFMSIGEKQILIKGMIEMHIEKSLGTLEKEHEQSLDQIEKCEKEIKQDTHYIEHLKDQIAKSFNAHHLSFSHGNIEEHMEGSLFSVYGWIPSNHLPTLFPLLENLGIHTEEIAVEKGEKVPTYMENKGFGKIGEDLVHIYDVPSPLDKDPSPWVFWTFVIFFSIIISDAGYGLIYFILALFLKRKMRGQNGSGKRFATLVTSLSIGCMVWGVFTGAYFGIEFAPNNPLNNISITHNLALEKANYHIQHQDETYHEWLIRFPELKSVKDGAQLLQEAVVIKEGNPSYIISDQCRDSILMELALMIGVVHISLSLFRQLRRNVAGFGWICAIVGGYLFFPKILDSTSILHFTGLITKAKAFEIGKPLLYGGIGLAVVLAVVQDKLKGLFEVTKSIELFSDVLSYLRLYALGLAAMKLALTFNDMAQGKGIIAQIILLLAGHTINISVGIMGGVVHGLRLNFVEWYHHSFEGGGKLFNPLKLLKIRGE